MSNGITLEEFVISLGFAVDPKQLTDAERQAKAAADRVTEAWGKVATAIRNTGLVVGGVGGAMFKLAERSAAAAAAIDDMAQRTRASARDLQRLKFAAEQSGTTIDVVAGALKALDVALVEGAKATGPAHDALRALGLTAAELVDLPAEQKFATIADAIGKIENPALKTRTAMALFGGAGDALLPLLSQGSSGIRQLGDEAERLGLVMSDAAIQGAAKFDDELTKVKAQVGAVSREIGMALLPAVTSMLRHFDDVIKVAGGLAVAFGGIKAVTLAHDLGLVGSSLAAIRWTAGIAGAAGLGVALGTALDNALGLSDALAGVNQNVGSRGGSVPLGELTSDERAALDAAVARRDEAQAKAESGTSRNTPAERIYRNEAQAAQDEIDQIQARARASLQGRSKLAASRDQVTTTAGRLTGAAAIERGNTASQRANDLLRKFSQGKKGGGGGGAARGVGVDFDAAVFAYDDLHGDEVRRLGARFGVGEAGIDAALRAGADALAQGDTDFVARNAALSRLSSSAGVDLTVKRQRDPLLSQILGDEQVPDVALSSIARGTEPQVLISNITNTFHQDFKMQIDGAGDPREVASQTVTAFREIARSAAEKATKTAKVNVLS